MTAKYNVGDVVLYRERWRPGEPPRRRRISKVARKYFYVEGDDRLRFSVVTGVHHDGHGGVTAFLPSEWDHLQALQCAREDLQSWGVRFEEARNHGKLLAVRDALRPILGAP